MRQHTVFSMIEADCGPRRHAAGNILALSAEEENLAASIDLVTVLQAGKLQ